jgi:hypothetical protein
MDHRTGSERNMKQTRKAAVLAGVLFAVAVGCGPKPSPTGREPPPGGSPTDDFQKFLAWAAGPVRKTFEVAQKENDLATAEVTREANKELSAVVGRDVRWKIDVAEVSAHAVRFADQWIWTTRVLPETKAKPSPDEKAAGILRVTAVAGAEPPAGFAGAAFGDHPPAGCRQMEIGKAITPEQAKKLSRDDTVTVTGKIYQCEIGSRAFGGSTHYVSLVIVNAKAVD